MQLLFLLYLLSSFVTVQLIECHALTLYEFSLDYEFSISSISAGVTTIGFLGKCLILPVTR